MPDYDKQLKEALLQMRLEDEFINGEKPKNNMFGEPIERQEINVNPRGTGTILDRFSLEGSGSKGQGVTAMGGRLGYTQPIDDSSEIEGGISGHYVKGPGFKDTAVDRADVSARKKFKGGSELRGRVSGNLNRDLGKRGIDQANVEYEIPFKKGGKVSTASKRGDGIAQRGKTRGKLR